MVTSGAKEQGQDGRETISPALGRSFFHDRALIGRLMAETRISLI
jgi:hypothetical protein